MLSLLAGLAGVLFTVASALSILLFVAVAVVLVIYVVAVVVYTGSNTRCCTINFVAFSVHAQTKWIVRSFSLYLLHA